MRTRNSSLHALKTRLARPVLAAAVAAALALAGGGAPAAAAAAQARLRETPDGCALLTLDDQVLFEAVGFGARAACLQRATETGVVRIL
jgi:ABC-type sugar transport system substrate-binding protein